MCRRAAFDRRLGAGDADGEADPGATGLEAEPVRADRKAFPLGEIPGQQNNRLGSLVEVLLAGRRRDVEKGEFREIAYAGPNSGIEQLQERARVLFDTQVDGQIEGAQVEVLQLALPYADLFWTGVLTFVIGLVIASAFSAILVYAQELVPGRVGMIGGLFFGLAFGMGGIGAAVLGALADVTSIRFVYQVCSFLPAIGLLTGFLPDLDRPRRRRLVPA